jgi:hypothetical protein
VPLYQATRNNILEDSYIYNVVNVKLSLRHKHKDMNAFTDSGVKIHSPGTL